MKSRDMIDTIYCLVCDDILMTAYDVGAYLRLEETLKNIRKGEKIQICDECVNSVKTKTGRLPHHIKHLYHEIERLRPMMKHNSLRVFKLQKKLSVEILIHKIINYEPNHKHQ